MCYVSLYRYLALALIPLLCYIRTCLYRFCCFKCFYPLLLVFLSHFRLHNPTWAIWCTSWAIGADGSGDRGNPLPSLLLHLQHQRAATRGTVVPFVPADEFAE